MSTVSASEDTIEDDDLEDIAFLQNALFVLDPKRKKPRIDHRVLPRNTRTKYRHKEATHCIQRDYIGVVGDPTTPLFKGKEFDTMFRVSRGRFQRLLEDIGNSGDPFYLETRDCFGNEVASMEARILLPLKCLAFGVPPKTFRDYFQMSKTFARECCINFNRKVKELYQEEYLRFPTQADLKAITESISRQLSLYKFCFNNSQSDCGKGCHEGAEEEEGLAAGHSDGGDAVVVEGDVEVFVPTEDDAQW